MEKLKCIRCQHEWIPKVATPSVCPRCKSPFWNKPYRVKKPLHPDGKPMPIIEQYEAERVIYGTSMKIVMEDEISPRDMSMYYKETYDAYNKNPEDYINENPIVATPEPVDETTGVILKALTAILDRLEKIENRTGTELSLEEYMVKKGYPMAEENLIPYVATKEQSSESFICAKTHMFICPGENKALCSICKQQDFWKNATNLRVALEMEDIEKPGEVAPEDTFEVKALNCKERETNAGLPFCCYRYKGEFHNNYCARCIEMIEIWGEQAAGYAQQMKEKK